MLHFVKIFLLALFCYCDISLCERLKYQFLYSRFNYFEVGPISEPLCERSSKSDNVLTKCVSFVAYKSTNNNLEEGKFKI